MADALSRCRTRLVIAALVAGVLGAGSLVPADAARRKTPDPNVSGPVAGGYGRATGGLPYDVRQYGYTEREYFFAGTAKAYGTIAPPAAYRTRMVVWTPTDLARFNGTTVVEWAEVSGYENAPEIAFQAPMLERDGYAFVLVSAQEGGVCGQTPAGCSPLTLKGIDPVRYASLTHPGDAYSYDIFSQALRAIKQPVGVAPLGRLRAGTVIAEGFQVIVDRSTPDALQTSSSTGMLDDYLTNGADADAHLADAFFVDAGEVRDPSWRYRVPTINHLSEDWQPLTPIPDSTNHVTWEIAGAPHADRWAVDHSGPPGNALTGPSPLLSRKDEDARRDRLDDYGQKQDPGAAVCAPSSGNAALTSTVFPRRFSVDAATTALRQWVRTGEPAPSAPPLQRGAAVPRTPETKLARDGDGNAIGGWRSPIIDVPVATYDGEQCSIFGTTTPLPPTRLAALYPTHAAYVRKLLAATDRAVAMRYLICEDAVTILRKASASTVGGTDSFTAAPACLTR